MGRQRVARIYDAVIGFVAILAILGSIIFYSGVPWELGEELGILCLLLIYLHSYALTLGQVINYSLCSSAIFPIIYLFGPTPAMIMGGLMGVLDGFIYKKSIKRIIFNMCQLALSALAGSLVFQMAKGNLEPLDAATLGGMIIGAFAYMVTNIFLVSLLVVAGTGRTLWYQLSKQSVIAFYNSLGMGFIGIIFTLFIISYGFWGLLAFSALLIHLSSLLRIATEVQDERSKRMELEEELMIDELTGAYNFRFLSKWLDEDAMNNVAVLFLDIDNFKKFNDEYGHAEGDMLLKTVVERIRNSIRPDDRVIRYGGDEFVILLMDNDVSEAKQVAERITTNLYQVKVPDATRPITVSIGISSTCSDALDKRQLLLRSDQAMYVAKNSGKNAISLWNAQKGPA